MTTMPVFKKIFLLILLSVLLAPSSVVFAMSHSNVNVSLNNGAGSASGGGAACPGPVPIPTPIPVPIPKPLPDSGMISIDFDDGLLASYTLAAPIMKEYGFKGTAYVYTQAQNEQEPGYYNEFMSWDQVVSLQNYFGWEIGSHSYSHPDLTQMPFDQAKWEIDQSRNDLIAHGINPQSFASPYGAYNNEIVNYAAKLFSSHRTAWNLPNTYPINDYYLKARPVLPDTDPATVKSWIDSAKANNEWLILYFHSLTPGTAQPANDDYNVNNFREILSYIKQTNIPLVTISQAVKAWARGENLVPNYSFEQGAGDDGDNWIRSNKSKVKIARQQTGAYPYANSLALINGGSASNSSLSTYGINVDGSKNYRLKAFFRVSDYVKGDTSIWLSEFDENYGYLGGQWLAGFNYNFLGSRYYNYTPSPGAKIAEIFFLTHANSTIKFEIDNVELREL